MKFDLLLQRLIYKRKREFSFKPQGEYIYVIHYLLIFKGQTFYSSLKQ